MTVTSAQVAALPKAELHLHVEGTLEPELALELAARNGVALPYHDVAALRNAYSFSDLRSFLTLYYECMAVLRTAEDFADLASAYLARARADGVTRVEMFFDPQMHASRGVPLAEVIGGLRAAADRSAASGGPQVWLIACFLRDRGPDDAMTTLGALAGHVGQLPAQLRDLHVLAGGHLGHLGAGDEQEALPRLHGTGRDREGEHRRERERRLQLFREGAEGLAGGQGPGAGSAPRLEG